MECYPLKRKPPVIAVAGVGRPRSRLIEQKRNPGGRSVGRRRDNLASAGISVVANDG
jgi:hypothetical protein